MEISSNKGRRGRPRKVSVNNETRLAITILLYALEDKLKEDGVIENNIETLLIGSAWDEAFEHILKENRKIWGRWQYEDRPKCGCDFFKNLINIKKGKENCDHPLSKSLVLLVQYAFHNDTHFQGWKWTDFLEIFKQNCFDNTLFFAPDKIIVNSLEMDEILIIGWIPQHFYIMQYRGNYKFKILLAGDGMSHSKGDEFYAESFGIEYPTFKQPVKNSDGNLSEKEFPAYALPYLSYKPHPIEFLE